MAPDLSQGVEVCRASLSYYTVNKVSKRDFDTELEGKRKELKQTYNKELNQQLLQTVGFLDYLENEYQSDIQLVSIQDLYEALKKFEAQKKSEFMQAVQQGKQAEELIKDFPLFNVQKDVMQNFINISNKIDEKNLQKQKSQNEKEKKGLTEEIRKLRINRGKYFQNRWGFPNYVNFAITFLDQWQ